MTEEESFALDISEIIEKIRNNKKLVVYSVLLLILVFSFYLRMIPAEHQHLSAMDPYWVYRRASEIVDHGFPGQALKQVGERFIPWDYLHDAPHGSYARPELYPVMVAHSYRAIGQFLVSDLLTWHKLTPAFFGVGAVFAMFLLAKQLFGNKAGLASAFLYSLSSPFMIRSVAGFSDTDAPIAFFSLLTLFLFIKAWDKERPKERLYWGISAGFSLGLLGLTWPSGYSYIPNLILGSAVILIGFEAVLAFYKKGSMSNAFKIVNEYSKNYLPFLLVFFLVASSVVLLSFGADDPLTPKREIDILHSPANIFRGAFRIFNLKDSPGTDVKVRHVYLTVAEMNPTKLREVISRLHIALFAIIMYLPIALYLGLWKKMKKLKFHFIFLFLWFIGFLYGSLAANRFIIMLAMPLCIFAGVCISNMLSQINLKKPILSIGIVVALIFLLFTMPNIPASADSTQLSPPYVSAGVMIPTQVGPSLGQNWHDLFEWMRTETEPHTVSEDYTEFTYGDIMASWWDPGHAVTALGERPAVADGSQNFRHVHNLSIVFTTTDEKEAYDLLKSYNVTYFFTSTDLISKYGAISFLASSGPGGGGENYPIVSLVREEVQQTEDGYLLSYYMGQNQRVLVNLKNNGEISATYNEGYQKRKIARVFYVHEGSALIAHEQENDTIDALFYIYPDYSRAIFMPPRLENNMLTRLHLFEGAGMEYFELVKTFEDQIKVFKLK